MSHTTPNDTQRPNGWSDEDKICFGVEASADAATVYGSEYGCPEPNYSELLAVKGPADAAGCRCMDLITQNLVLQFFMPQCAKNIISYCTDSFSAGKCFEILVEATFTAKYEQLCHSKNFPTDSLITDGSVSNPYQYFGLDSIWHDRQVWQLCGWNVAGANNSPKFKIKQETWFQQSHYGQTIPPTPRPPEAFERKCIESAWMYHPPCGIGEVGGYVHYFPICPHLENSGYGKNQVGEQGQPYGLLEGEKKYFEILVCADKNPQLYKSVRKAVATGKGYQILTYLLDDVDGLFAPVANSFVTKLEETPAPANPEMVTVKMNINKCSEHSEVFVPPTPSFGGGSAPSQNPCP